MTMVPVSAGRHRPLPAAGRSDRSAGGPAAWLPAERPPPCVCGPAGPGAAAPPSPGPRTGAPAPAGSHGAAHRERRRAATPRERTGPGSPEPAGARHSGRWRRQVRLPRAPPRRAGGRRKVSSQRTLTLDRHAPETGGASGFGVQVRAQRQPNRESRMRKMPSLAESFRCGYRAVQESGKAAVKQGLRALTKEMR